MCRSNHSGPRCWRSAALQLPCPQPLPRAHFSHPSPPAHVGRSRQSAQDMLGFVGRHLLAFRRPGNETSLSAACTIFLMGLTLEALNYGPNPHMTLALLDIRASCRAGRANRCDLRYGPRSLIESRVSYMMALVSPEIIMYTRTYAVDASHHPSCTLRAYKRVYSYSSYLIASSPPGPILPYFSKRPEAGPPASIEANNGRQ